ncbi:MMPL family transporter [Glutamicibacter sp. MNS18]|uniref:MMPL family transporter n=1 Tax=Glutamicibacter sp. MNS18 TaxID=2989817 RepID=UPI002235DBE1|nr:MMPL family transporter [Glutamicibacter sp. MNS18]MCW4465149.1 MMPL family transporter [Glutamicibacter sp. MNS18]
MATFLYRLASWAHRHRMRMISIWLAVFIAIGTSATLFMGQLSNTFTLPGTETQRTMDRMKDELPDLAGGSGAIVFRESSNRELSKDQGAAIESALDQLEHHPEVVSVARPFELQEQLDAAEPELAKAQRELEDGQRQLEEGREQIADGKLQLEDARKELTEGWAQLFDGQKEIAEAEPQISAAEVKLATGWRELRAGEAELRDGQSQLDAGTRQWEAGLAEYNTGYAQYREGRTAFEAGEKKVAAAAREIAAGEKQYQDGMKRILGDSTRAEFDEELATGKTQAQQGLEQAEEGITQLDAGISEAEAGLTELQQALAAAQEAGDTEQVAELEQQINAVQEQLEQLAAQRAQAVAGKQQATEALEKIAQAESGLGQLDAARKELDAGQSQLDYARQELEANRGQLDAASSQLATAKSQLDAGKRELTSNQAKLDAGQRELAAGRAELNAGQAEFNEQKAQFEAGKAELAAAEQELKAGEATITEKTRELEEAEAKLPEAERELERGRAELDFAARQVGASSGMRFISEDGSTAVAQVSFRGQTDALTAADREAITAIAIGPQAVGVEVLFSQEILQDISEVFGAAEVIGIIVAAIVLLVMLGTLVAAGLPLLLALLGVGAGVGTTLAFSSLVDMASITPALALMLGLAVGIDYALFIIHRHRTQLLGGMDVGESIARAVGTSGNAVVFAGLTVIIALAALVVPGLPFLSILGLSAAFTVLMAVLLAITLLPALLSLVGGKIVSKKARAKAAAGQAREAKAGRWVAMLTKAAVPVTLIVVALLGTIALPATQMRTALPDGSAEAEDSMAFQAYEQTADKFGAGYNGPLLVLADLPQGLTERQADTLALDVADELRTHEQVVAAIPVTMTEDRTLAAIQVVPGDGPASEATENLVHDLRDDAQRIQDATGITDFAVTGQVAAQIDVSEVVTAALAPYLAIVVGLSLILLLLVFRSLVVPILATGGFLLSLAAAFGASTAVYQFGWLSEVFGVNVPGPLLSFLPILLTGILFGLAMDYQVFLVSAMRERFVHGESARDAVRSGFSMTAPVVTAAALIMISVFAGFIFSHLSMIRPLGFALAFGVLFDAFVVRMTLIPAVMHLLGDKAWYLPKWLDRILPNVDVEGEALTAMLDRRQVEATADNRERVNA